MSTAADVVNPVGELHQGHPHLLDTRQAVKYLSMGESTLRAHRTKGTGPPYIHLGRRFIRYEVGELDRWVDALSTRPGPVTTAQLLGERWWDMGGRCERNKLPGILRDHFDAGSFTVGRDKRDRPIYDTQLLAHALESAWGGAEYPEAHLEPEEWTEMFFIAQRHLKYPDDSVTLYRGVGNEMFNWRMSWTSSLETARWFAKRHTCRYGGGVVYRLVDVEPSAVFAMIDDRGEDEYVLDLEEIFSGDIEIFEDYREMQPANEPTAATTGGLP